MKNKFLFVIIFLFASGLFIQSNISGTNKWPNKKEGRINKSISVLNHFQKSNLKNSYSPKTQLTKTVAGLQGLTQDKIKTFLAEKAKSAKTNNLMQKRDNQYFPAKGVDNDGWFWDENFFDSYQIDFNLTQSTPITYSNFDCIGDEVLGGTTLNYGFGVVSAYSSILTLSILNQLFFHNSDVGETINPYDEFPYYFMILDMAFDHTTNELYVLYFDGEYPAGRSGKTAVTDYAKNPKRGKNGDGVYGIFLARYKFDFVSFLGLMEPVVSNLIPVYTPAPGEDDVSMWQHLYMGLACNRSGQLYTVDYLTKKICTINKTTGQVTAGPVLNVPFGNPSSDPYYYIVGELVNLEFDLRDNKLYLLDAFIDAVHGGGGCKGCGNVDLTSSKKGNSPGFSQLYQVNVTNGNSTLLTHGTVYNYLWEEDGSTPIEEHFIGGLQIPVSGIMLVHPASFILDPASAGSIYQIAWFSTNVTSSKIEYSTNNGTNWITIAENVPTQGNDFFGISEDMYEWQVPHGLPSQIKIRVSNADDNLFWDACDLEVQDMVIISPNGGENWLAGTTQIIQWYFNVIENLNGSVSKTSTSNVSKELTNDGKQRIGETVSISYQLNGTDNWVLIASGIPVVNGINNYKWDLSDLSPGQYKIKIEYYGYYSELIAVSTNYFTLFPQPAKGKYILTSPNGGEVWNSGTVHTITWRKTSAIVPGTIILQLSTDNGKTWADINNDPLAGTVRFNWLIPTEPKINSNLCLVRMVNGILKTEYDRSNFLFTINTPTTQTEAANYPNPFNPSTKIAFGLEKSSFISLKVYNSIGQQVAELVNRQLEAGLHEFEFNAAKLPSGVYYYNLTRDGSSEIHKMLLLK